MGFSRVEDDVDGHMKVTVVYGTLQVRGVRPDGEECDSWQIGKMPTARCDQLFTVLGGRIFECEEHLV